LLEKRPKALSKAQIHEAIWPDAFVSEATLASLIAEIRHALGEEGRGSGSIRTVHGYGYAFQGAVSTPRRPSRVETGSATVYRLILGAREIALGEGENILGRDQDASVWIDDPSVSRRHARILINGDTAQLEDLQSKNGTYLGEELVQAAAPLKDGDQIRLGAVTLRVRAHPGGGSTATQVFDRG
jgi:pSer/pThr/pTyr-binding forkhead associated (FHA) protein